MIPVKQIGFIPRTKEIYVDPSGSDTYNDGTLNKP